MNRRYHIHCLFYGDPLVVSLRAFSNIGSRAKHAAGEVRGIIVFANPMLAPYDMGDPGRVTDEMPGLIPTPSGSWRVKCELTSSIEIYSVLTLLKCSISGISTIQNILDRTLRCPGPEFGLHLSSGVEWNNWFTGGVPW